MALESSAQVLKALKNNFIIYSITFDAPSTTSFHFQIAELLQAVVIVNISAF